MARFLWMLLIASNPVLLALYLLRQQDQQEQDSAEPNRTNHHRPERTLIPHDPSPRR